MRQAGQGVGYRARFAHRQQRRAGVDQRAGGMPDHGLAKKCEELFRRVTAETASGAGSDEDGGEMHADRQAQSTGQVNPPAA